MSALVFCSLLVKRCRNPSRVWWSTCESALSTLILWVEMKRSTSVMGWASPSGAWRWRKSHNISHWERHWQRERERESWQGPEMPWRSVQTSPNI